MASIPELQNGNARHALVMGLGRFGGGRGITQYLLKHGWNVTLNDKASQQQLAEQLSQIGDHERLHLALGEHDPESLHDVDFLVVNPAVPTPWQHRFIQAAYEAEIAVTTEIEIAYRLVDPSRIIAITGSAGKSTTSVMAHAGLIHAGYNAQLGGNIGGSLLDHVGSITSGDPVILELSSAMLYWLWGEHRSSPPPPPKVACITSYSPNHIDWHHDESHYRQSKQLLARILPSESQLVIPDTLSDWTQLTSAATRVVKPLEAIESCMVLGAHNAMNAAMALACTTALEPGANTQLLLEGIRSFEGLPHRLHCCLERSGVLFIDDSKSTTPQATTLAVEAASTRVDLARIHLIAGGYDKGSDLSPIADLAPNLAGLYTIGTTGQSIFDLASKRAYHCETIERAMSQIFSRISHGDVVLLSPGCASWDQFTNYESRGLRFKELAMNYQFGATC